MLAVLASTFTCVALVTNRDGPSRVAPCVIFPVRLTVVAAFGKFTLELALMFMLVLMLTVGAAREMLKKVVPKLGLKLRSMLSTTLMLLVAETLTLVNAIV